LRPVGAFVRVRPEPANRGWTRRRPRCEQGDSRRQPTAAAGQPQSVGRTGERRTSDHFQKKEQEHRVAAHTGVICIHRGVGIEGPVYSRTAARGKGSTPADYSSGNLRIVARRRRQGHAGIRHRGHPITAGLEGKRRWLSRTPARRQLASRRSGERRRAGLFTRRRHRSFGWCGLIGRAGARLARRGQRHRHDFGAVGRSPSRRWGVIESSWSFRMSRSGEGSFGTGGCLGPFAANGGKAHVPSSPVWATGQATRRWAAVIRTSQISGPLRRQSLIRAAVQQRIAAVERRSSTLGHARTRPCANQPAA